MGAADSVMEAVPGLTEAAAGLRRSGFGVYEVPGWQTRGIGALRPRGFVNHHTAGSLAGGNAASLRVVTFGRPGLRNALSNWYVARDGTVHLVAAGVAWHAGAGGWRGLSGNASVLGCEAENNGVGEPWGRDSLAAQAALNAECCRTFGFSVEMVCEHFEWAPGRKVDRFGIDPDVWRAGVAGLLTSASLPPDEEDDMPKAKLLTIDSKVYIQWPDGDRVYVFPEELAEMHLLVSLGLLESTKPWPVPADSALLARILREVQV